MRQVGRLLIGRDVLFNIFLKAFEHAINVPTTIVANKLVNNTATTMGR